MSKIEKSTDYSKFKCYELNRDVSEDKVAELKAAIRKNDLTPSNPIIVNENWEIVDGQHRFYALMQMEKPIYYVQAELNGEMDDVIINLNTNQSNWRMLDYCKHYAGKGKENYDLILKLMKKFNLPISPAIVCVTSRMTGNMPAIRSGNLAIGELKPETSAQIVSDFGEIIKFNKHNKFVKAIVSMLKQGKYDHNSDFLRFRKHAGALERCENVSQYFRLFEYIMNKGRSAADKVELKREEKKK